MQIDEARDHDQVRRVDGASSGSAGEVSEGDDATTLDSDVCTDPGVSASVDDPSVLDEEIELLTGSLGRCEKAPFEEKGKGDQERGRKDSRPGSHLGLQAERGVGGEGQNSPVRT